MEICTLSAPQTAASWIPLPLSLTPLYSSHILNVHSRRSTCKLTTVTRSLRPTTSHRNGDMLRFGIRGPEKIPSRNSREISASISSATSGTFRSGQKRAEVEVPSLVLTIDSHQVLEESGEFCEVVDAAVAGGATVIVLQVGDAGDGGKLFEAACKLNGLIRGRAQLLVAERADIAAAAGANGVVLSDQGLPAVVARRMMESASSTPLPSLPLIARTVNSVTSALSATSAEGADLLIVQQAPLGTELSIAQLAEKVSIPVIRALAAEANSSTDSKSWPTADQLEAGCSGISLTVSDFMAGVDPAVEGDARRYASQLLNHIRLQQGDAAEESVQQPDAELAEADAVQEVEVEVEQRVDEKEKPWSSVPFIPAKNRVALEQVAKFLTEKERLLLTDVLQLLETAAPEMAEISLLRDALSHLDDPFLIVIVGEFNSGKSSVINALLGGQFLAEGVVPTTNEITLLRYSQDAGRERAERHPDGHFIRFLPAGLLKQMNLVDTPGTNVILERQQRLTEEFVPRADMVLFVLSADRPLTESEVSFLRYIRQWGKKVVFVLNKADLLAANEVEEVLTFVSGNVKRLLSIDSLLCFPVSARRAMAAKLAAFHPHNGTPTPLPALDTHLLSQDSRWQTSGFSTLERFILGFMDGSSDAGVERIRLKLDTPIGVASALLASVDRQLAREGEAVAVDARWLDALQDTVEVQCGTLQREGARWRLRVQELVDATCERAEKFVDDVLRADNIANLAQYVVTDVSKSGSTLPAGRKFETQVLGAGSADLRGLLLEHRSWLATKTSQYLQSHGESAAARWPQLAEDGELDLSKAMAAQLSVAGSSVGLLEEFNAKAAALLLDEELRLAVMELFKSLSAAGASATVLTSVLPTSVEDLLALAVCSLGGYAGVMKLPQRREEVKAKVRRAAQGLAAKIVNGMEEDVDEMVAASKECARLALRSYRGSVEREIERVTKLRRSSEQLSLTLKALRVEIQNIGC